MEKTINYLLLIGRKENWEVSFKKKLWGSTKKTKRLWEKIKKGDFLAFYVTSPIKLVIGFGIVEDKIKDEKLIFPLEKSLGESMWPYKITFSVINTCRNWDNGIKLPNNMILQTSQKLIDKEMYFKMVRQADKKWNTHIKKIIS